mmetsp:Transcript_70116/g.196469  ORF Transcript_70116/g.196469 Transcript_70116/m.196469 type:complete len:517 (-) Transcript_70116:225-1775(-)
MQPNGRAQVRKGTELRQGINEEELRDVFDKFDFDGSGSIDERELQQAMRLLGVSCSLNTATKVLRQIDIDSNGTIEWTEFQAFFSRVSDPEDLKDFLSQQCHRFFEYKQAVESDPSFGKTFKIPPNSMPNRRLEGHNESVESIAWLSDDELISGSIDGEVLLWNLATEGPRIRPQRRFQAGKRCALYSMATDSASRSITTGLDGRGASNLRRFTIDDGEEKMAYEGHTAPVYCVGMSSDGMSVASGSKSGEICTHDIESAAPLTHGKVHDNVVHSVAYLDDATMLCSASKDGTVKIFDGRSISQSARPMYLIEDAATAGAVLQAVWHSQHQIVTCGDDYCIKRWDLRHLQNGPVQSYFGHTSIVRCVESSPDRSFIASGTKSGSVRIWITDEVGKFQEKAMGAELQLEVAKREFEEIEAQFESGSLPVDDLRAAKDRRSLAESEAEAMRASYGELKRRGFSQAVFGCEGSKMPVTSLAWRPSTVDGKLRLAVGAQDQAVCIYDLDGEKLSASTVGP